MPQCTKQVRPQIRSKSDISGAVAAAWGRLVNKHGRGALADKLDVTTKTINRALTGENVPSLDTAFNALAIDPTALQEVAALYGYQLCPITCCPGEEETTRARLAHVLSEWLAVGALTDHRAKCRLADEIRELLPALLGMVAQADGLRGRAA